MKKKTFALIALLLALSMSACSCLSPFLSTPTSSSAESSTPVSIHTPSAEASKQSGAFVSEPADGMEFPYVDPNIITTFKVADFSYHYSTLKNEGQRLMYKAIAAAVFAGSKKTDSVDADVTSDDAAAAYQAVLDDYPQIFDVGDSYTLVTEREFWGKTAYSCKLTYDASSTETMLARRASLYAAVNAILSQAKSISDPAERQKFFYKRVIEAGSYDYDEAAFTGKNFTAHSAYGTLVEKRCVCDGYAKAFMLLCVYGGIECRVVSGELAAGKHAWNAVTLNGKTYYCDPTLDDIENLWYDENGVYSNPESTRGMKKLSNFVAHCYYNATYDEMAANHIFYDAKTSADASSSLGVAAKGVVKCESVGSLYDELVQILSEEIIGDGAAEVMGFSFDIALGFSVVDISSHISAAAQTAGFSGRYLIHMNGANTRFHIFFYG